MTAVLRAPQRASRTPEGPLWSEPRNTEVVLSLYPLCGWGDRGLSMVSDPRPGNRSGKGTEFLGSQRRLEPALLAFLGRQPAPGTGGSGLTPRAWKEASGSSGLETWPCRHVTQVRATWYKDAENRTVGMKGNLSLQSFWGFSMLLLCFTKSSYLTYFMLWHNNDFWCVDSVRKLVVSNIKNLPSNVKPHAYKPHL